MTTLQALADARDEILKAELAALLHNLGKLDVNFLAEAVDGSTSHHIQQHNSEITNYIFKRFAKPDLGIFSSEMTEIVSISWKNKQEFRQALSNINIWTEEEQNNIQLLISDYKNQKENLPLLAKKIDSLWEFSRFFCSNGPLYFCHVEERQKNQQPLQQINAEIEDLQKSLKQPGTDKRELGNQLQNKKQKKSEVNHAVQEDRKKIRTTEEQNQLNLEIQLRGITLNLGGEIWSLADLLTLFWDDFFYKPDGNDYKRQSTLTRWLKSEHATRIPALLVLSHGEVSGTEKDNAGVPGSWENLILTTAFGFEQRKPTLWDMAENRWKIVDTALKIADHISKERFDFLDIAEKYLKDALSDTQWPWNEITLWNYASSIAALFKSSAASIVLCQSIPSVSDTRWRLLHVSFDGLAFWSHAHHITDMLARRETLQKGLDAVRELLEVQYPLGNEIYRDEHGSVFVVADFDNLLNLTDNRGESLKILLLEAFDGEGIKGELQPEIEVSKAYRGKEMKLAQILERRGLTRLLDVEQITPSWSEEFRPKQSPICTVCGIRPVGYPGEDADNTQDFAAWATQEKAMNQNICRVCLQRRGRRAKRWSNQEDTSFEQTVWIDEVADINAGVALIVSRFVLDDWLNGKLIATLQKSDSFARIQRCWETTRTFWKEIEQNILPKESGTQKQMRLMIQPTNAAHLQKSLANYHTYELDTKGIRIGVCWDADRGLFLSTANLRYVAKLLGIERKIWQDDEKLLAMLKDEVITGNLHIYERGGYGARERKISPVAENCQVIEESVFKPFIPLATEPAMFMALVPTNRAKDVARAIKAKYDKEMARVHDRLPIHLGIIFALRRTTVQTMLDAGRKMLTMPGQWEPWKVYPSPSSQRHIRFEQGSRSFFWEYPAYMGDGSTTDIWYSHLLTTDPSTDEINVVPVDQLQSGQTVYIRPSRFDFEFLDTTDRRFDIAYDQHGRRPARATRSYLLDDLDRLDVIWRVMKLLKPAQRHQVIQTIEATRELWYGNDRGGLSQQDEVFRQFVSDTLAGASWPEGRQWKQLSQKEQQLLMQAGVRGELADLLELHHAILKEEEEQPVNDLV